MNPIHILVTAFHQVADEQNTTVTVKNKTVEGTHEERVWPTIEDNLAASTILAHAVRYLRSSQDQVGQ